MFRTSYLQLIHASAVRRGNSMGYFTMAGTTLANLFRKPATRLYPFVKRDNYSATRGHISIEFDKCIHCTICAKKCPTDAIIVDRAAKSWQINHIKCIACSSCTEACPKKCLTMNSQYRAPVNAEGKKSLVETHTGA